MHLRDGESLRNLSFAATAHSAGWDQPDRSASNSAGGDPAGQTLPWSDPGPDQNHREKLCHVLTSHVSPASTLLQHRNHGLGVLLGDGPSPKSSPQGLGLLINES